MTQTLMKLKRKYLTMINMTLHKTLLLHKVKTDNFAAKLKEEKLAIRWYY